MKAAVSAAARTLASQSSYGWRTTVEDGGSGGSSGGAGGGTSGQMARDSYIWVRSSSGRGGFEFVLKGAHAAVLLDGNWMPLDDAARRPAGEGAGPSGPWRFLRSRIAGFNLPAAEAEGLAAGAVSFQELSDGVSAELGAEVVKALLSATGPAGRRGGGGGRGGPRGSEVKDPRGTVLFTIQDGVLTGITITVSGTREARGSEIKLSRKMTTLITEIGSTQVAIPPDAKEIVDALASGRTPRVFVAEPGFRKLFNGRDLTGWAGRPEHWSVEDGAITGRTSRENPAKGNNFLIAKDGHKSLIVNDFELRFSWRIVAENSTGFANSGMQYRSKELPDFVAAGYQADFEAGTTYSGILYDEAGGAGGRGIMADRGQLVVWGADGKKTVTGQCGDPDAIQKAIRQGGWNEYVIVAEGSRLQHFLNGVQTVGVIDEDGSRRLTSGIIGIQIHAGEPMTVQVKDIRIKPLGTLDAVGGSVVKAAKDFKVELLYTVPKETEGSWVAMCFDPKGRLIVSEQSGGLHRVTLPQAAGGAVRTERIDVDIGGAHGLLYAFDSLYVMVNERSRRGLHRVRDTDLDDRFDRVEVLREIQGGGEHGMHSLVPSPDGKSIYVVCGNSTNLTSIESSLVPLVWSEDDLLRRLPTGFMDDSLAPQGWIARIDPDGAKWELVAMGLRNPFDIAFNNVGELFTYDADMEWDIGEPWYRPTRVNHVVSGAEFGFRNGNGKWPEHYLDSFGTAADIGPGSPTGITFGYGARFPAKYQAALYLADWSFGKIRALHLTPEGASYRGEVEEFVSGQPLPVTDVVLSPHDGAMYFAVGGRGAQSALYRVTYTGSESTAPGAPDDRLQARRDLRRKMETFHGRRDASAVEAVWPYLGDPDRSIRHAARVALEWQEPSLWRDRALAEKDARKAIAALTALARVSSRDQAHRKETDPAPDPELRSRMLSALDAIRDSSLSPDDRLDWLRACSLVFIRLGPPDDAARERLISRLDPLFPSRNREADALLARILVYLEAPGAAAKVVAALRDALTQEEQIDHALALRVLRTGWTMPLREEYFRWFTLKGAAYRGGNTFASSLRTMKAQAMETLSDDEKAALKAVLEAEPERKSPQEILAGRPLVRKWT
ncbi:MAG TPA: family 16 glycoside hydrolase, partial [Planctomycetota bacterium]|nr:family 16 glycoside hydrolase [Planctomycetota bacterium]